MNEAVPGGLELGGEVPLAPQFEGVDVVLDTGGSVGTRAMVDAATSVRLWQILGTGLGFFPESQRTLSSGSFYGPTGLELPGRTLCVVGFGASAQELAVRAHAMGMRVIGTDLREVSEAEARRWGAELIVPPAELDSLLRQSDVVSLHLHLTPATRHTIDERRIALMKEGAFVVNVARGALVDKDALVAAVRSGRLGGAGIDVFAGGPPAGPRTATGWRRGCHPSTASTADTRGVLT